LASPTRKVAVTLAPGLIALMFIQYPCGFDTAGRVKLQSRRTFGRS